MGTLHRVNAGPESDAGEPSAPVDTYWLALSVGLLALVTIVITLTVDAAQGPVWFDSSVSEWFISHRTPLLDGYFRSVTTLGRTPWSMIPMAVVVFVTVIRERYGLAVLMAASAVFGTVMSPIIKGAVGRPRPDAAVWLVDVDGASFPSGHALSSVTAWVAAAVVVILMVDDRRIRLVIGLIGGLVAVLIGVSRIYLGVHWPTDVIGGWAIAATWLTILLLIRQLVTSYGDRPARSR